MRRKPVLLAMVFTALASAVDPSPIAAEEGTAPDASGLPAGFRMDVNGDGVTDSLVAVLKGENRLEARDGATGQALWTSACWPKDLGETNQVGKTIVPAVYDMDTEGGQALVFVSRGCRAVVALDSRSGNAVWSLPLAETLGMTGAMLVASDPLQWYERDLVLADDKVLLAIRNTSALHAEEAATGGALEARNPRDGTVLWRKAMPLKSAKASTGWGFSVQDAFDVLREEQTDGVLLTIQPVGWRSTGAPVTTSVPVGSGGSVSFSVSAAKPHVLNGIADTARFLLEEDRVVYAGAREIRSLRLADGSVQWTWHPPEEKRLFNPAVAHHGTDVLLFAWIDRPAGAFLKDIILALLDESTGEPRWQKVIADMPSGSTFSPVSSRVTVRLGDSVTVDFASGNKKAASRVVHLDRRTGEIASSTGDAETGEME